MGGVAIIIATVVGYLVVAPGLTGGRGPSPPSGAAGAVPDHRAGRRRLPRRLHQDPQAAQPRPEQDGQAARPDLVVAIVFGVAARCASPNADGLTPGVDAPLLRPGHQRLTLSSALIAVRRLGVPARRGQVERGEPHRRPRRPGHRRRRSMVLGTYVVIAFWQFRTLLRDSAGARPAATRCATRWTSRWSRPPPIGGLHRLPVVERRAGPDLHGRHRLAGAGRPDRRAVHRSPAPSCCWSSSAGCSWSRRCRWSSRSSSFQHSAAAGVPDGAVPPPLRAGRLGGDHGDRPVLDARRARRGARAGAVLRRVPGRP